MLEDYYQALMRRNNNPELYFAHNGCRITAVGRDYTEAEMTVTRASLNPRGSVHGGAIAGLMDAVAGIAACTRGRSCVTLNNTVNFLRPAIGLDRLLCRAEVTKYGRTVSVSSCSVTDETGRVLAIGTYTFYMMEVLEAYKRYTADEPGENLN